MRIVATFAAAFMLMGCTTPSDLLRSTPELSATTTKDPKSYALCVFPYWQDYRSSAVMSETTDGYRIIAGAEASGQTDDVLDIRRTATGSIVNLYQRMAWSQMGRGGIHQSFNSCR